MSYPVTEVVGPNTAALPLESVVSKGSAEEMPELPRRLRRFLICFQILACIFTSILLMISLIAPSVFFSKITSYASLELGSVEVAVLTSNAFAAVCGALGLVSAIDKTPVLLAMSLVASMLASAMASALFSTMSSWCNFTYGGVECGPNSQTNYTLYTMDYIAMILNEAGILIFSILNIIATAFLLFVIYRKWKWTRLTRIYVANGRGGSC
jgi:hypothetical protein